MGVETSNWPLAMSAALHTSVILICARLWRLCVYNFDKYPWRLAPAYDPRSSEEEVNRVLSAFLQMDKESPQLDKCMLKFIPKVRLAIGYSVRNYVKQRNHRDLVYTVYQV